MYKTENITKTITRIFIEIKLNEPEYQRYCHCAKCVNDILAYSLTYLPTYYSRTDSERHNIFEIIKQEKTIKNINKQIIHAIYKVAKSNLECIVLNGDDAKMNGEVNTIEQPS